MKCIEAVAIFCIVNSLISLNKNYIKATPATSRNKRPGEKPNQDYYFLSEQEFVQKINNDAFFEYSNYLGLYYGTLKAPIYSDIECGKNVILDISLEEAFKLKRKYPEIILVYITPPDATTAIMRLRKREQNDKQVCDVASSAYLPHSGKSRLGCEAGTVMKFVFIPFVYCWRAGTD